MHRTKSTSNGNLLVILLAICDRESYLHLQYGCKFVKARTRRYDRNRSVFEWKRLLFRMSVFRLKFLRSGINQERWLTRRVFHRDNWWFFFHARRVTLEELFDQVGAYNGPIFTLAAIFRRSRELRKIPRQYPNVSLWYTLPLTNV